MTWDAEADTPAHDSHDQYTHLVILCCHAVYHGASGSDPRDENAWALKPFQKSTATKSGEHETFLQHAFAAVQLADANTLIAFSGGPTDAQYPDLSEAQSYLNAFRDWSRAIGMTVPKALSNGQVFLEERATDSYQNVLFSVLGFRRRTGYYPERLTIVTHAFKNERFLHLHSKALKWPAERVKVLGINPPFTRESCHILYIRNFRSFRILRRRRRRKSILCPRSIQYSLLYSHMHDRRSLS